MEKKRTGEAMIYDCFTFFNELDLLEIRLEELKDVVDRFVLVEATKTFSNNPKPLYYQENKARFAAFHDRIIHVIVDDLPENPKDSWENQFCQRNAISRGLSGCAPDDIIIVSDVDEIPRVTAVAGFSGEIAFLEQNLYYYRLNCLCITEKWAIPIIMRYRNLTSPQEARMYWYDKARRNDIPTIPNGGWHFSYLGDTDAIQLKLNSFSQQDFNTPEVNNKENIDEKVEAGLDLFNRPQYRWGFVQVDHTYPRAIYNNRFRYAQYIKGRDLQSTIFFDQYSRYKACAETLQSLAGDDATILDVGSGVDCLLGEFLPHRDITFVDPLMARLSHRPSYMIAGDPFCEELEGRQFDYVVSIDTLEHVPPEYRQPFLARLAKLARKGLVLAFPAHDAGDAVETDAWINSVFSCAYGKDYPWLEEHLENGLPSLQETLDQLDSLKWKTSVTQNGYTPWMRDLLAATLCGLEVHGFREALQELSTYFNAHLYGCDSASPGYRQIVVATKEEILVPASAGIDRTAAEDAVCNWKRLQRQTTAAPYAQLKEKDQLLAEKERELTERDRHFAGVSVQLAGIAEEMRQNRQQLTEATLKLVENERKLTEQNERLARKEQELAEKCLQITKHVQHIEKLQLNVAAKEQQLAELTTLLADRDQQVAKLTCEVGDVREQFATVAQEREQQVAELYQELATRAQHIGNLDLELQTARSYIQDLLNSQSWRITKPVRKISELLNRNG